MSLGQSTRVSASSIGYVGFLHESLPSSKYVVEYMAHLADTGDTRYVQQPEECGTTHLQRPMQGFAIRLVAGSKDVGLKYKVHEAWKGTTDWFYMPDFAGTRHESRQIEAIWIEVTGSEADLVDVYYQTHLAEMGFE